MVSIAVNYMASVLYNSPVGEPLNTEVWEWYHRVVGGERCTVVDTWW